MRSLSHVKVALLSENELVPQRAQIFKRLMSLGLLAGGAGALGRTLVDVLSPTKTEQMPFVSPGPSILPVPVNEPEQKKPSLMKLATDLAADDWATRLSKAWPGLVAKVPLIGTGLNSLEQHATQAGNAWWTGPAAVATGAAGVAGGYGIADWLLNKQRKNQVDSELDRAKKVYQQALLSQDPAMKMAGEIDPLVTKLDQVFDMLEKRADPANYASSYNPIKWLGAGGDVGNGVMGAYLTALGTLTGGAGYAGYRWAKGRSNNSLLQKAMQDRARKLWGTTAQPVEAVPMAVKQEENALAA